METSDQTSRRSPGHRGLRLSTRAVPLLTIAILLAAVPAAPPAAAANSNSTVDVAGSVGLYTSLALDTADYPVVAYFDSSAADLKVAHCNDPACTGADETITTVDAIGSVGTHTSLALDTAGNPVIAYYDATNANLKLAHCNDPACTGADETITTVDSAGVVGTHTSLALNGAGNPIVAYHDATNGALKLAHCNDPSCSGNDESITRLDSGSVGTYTSLALDAAGSPAVAYHDAANGALKLAHCNDPSCSGNDETVATVDAAGVVGMFSSLALGPAGNPIISHYDASNLDLKVTRCSDAFCAAATSVAVDDGGNVGAYTSVAVDGSGLAVVSHWGVSNSDLKVARCSTFSCLPDDSPPAVAASVEATVGDNGWYVSDIAVSWSVVEGDSVVTSVGCDAVVIAFDTPEPANMTCEATSDGGTTVETITVGRDATPPIVTVVGPVDGGAYTSDTAPIVACATSDAVSGVSVDATLTVTIAAETHTATCSGALDIAGNAAGAVAITYAVTEPEPAPEPSVEPPHPHFDTHPQRDRLGELDHLVFDEHPGLAHPRAKTRGKSR